MVSKSNLMFRFLMIFMLVGVLLAGLAAPAQAVVIDQTGQIPAGTTIDDDLLIAAEDVVVDGTINGTLIAAGNTVTINGLVKSDVLAFGRTVVIGAKAVIEGNLFTGASTVVMRGKVMGSVFGGAAGFTLSESGVVERNLYYGGFDLTAQMGSKIQRDLLAGGYQVIFNGQARNVKIAAAAIEISGSISGDADLNVGDADKDRYDSYRNFSFSWPDIPAAIKPGLRIAESAKIGGKLTYTSSTNQQNTIQAAPLGGTVYQTPVPSASEIQRETHQPTYVPRFAWEGFWLWAALRNLVTIVILGALALWLAPRLVERTGQQLRSSPLGALGIGLLALIIAMFAVPVAALGLILLGLLFSVVTLFELAGIILGLGFALYGVALAVFATLFLWAGKVILSLLMGRWVLSKLAAQSVVQPFWALALGALMFALLAAIPLAGFLFTFLVDLAGFGALWHVWRMRRLA